MVLEKRVKVRGSSLEEELLGGELLDELLDQLNVDVLGWEVRWGHPVRRAHLVAHVAHGVPGVHAGVRAVHAERLVRPRQRLGGLLVVAEDRLDDLLDVLAEDLLLLRLVQHRLDQLVDRQLVRLLVEEGWQDGLLNLATNKLLNQNLGHDWLREQGRGRQDRRFDWQNLVDNRAAR